jgi:hypothetical protein
LESQDSSERKIKKVRIIEPKKSNPTCDEKNNNEFNRLKKIVDTEKYDFSSKYLPFNLSNKNRPWAVMGHN